MTYYDRTEGFNPLCLAALRYAALGLRVFPLAPGTRIPLKGSHGYRDATLSPETIKGWWWRIPRANVGIATGRASGLLVLDVDPRNGGDESLRSRENDHGSLPWGNVVETPGGGQHHWFRYPDGIKLRCSDGRVAPGIDVKAEGGNILAPPSSRKDGPYKWITGGPRDLQEPPGWLIGAARPGRVPTYRPKPTTEPPRASTRYVQAALEGELRRVETAINGTRRSTLNSAAFALGGLVKAGALDESSTAEALLTRAIATGLSSHEARITISHAFEDAPERSRRQGCGR